MDFFRREEFIFSQFTQDFPLARILLIKSLDDLKDRLAKVILMILIVSFFKNVVHTQFDNPLDILYLGFGILMVALALYFTNKSGHHGNSGRLFSNHFLHKELNVFFEKKEGGVLGGELNRFIGSAFNRLGSDVILSCDKESVLNIFFRKPPQLRDNEIKRAEGLHFQVCVLVEGHRAIPVAWRHGDHRPAGNILPEIGGDLTVFKKLKEPLQIPAHFRIEIERRPLAHSVMLQCQRTDKNQLQTAFFQMGKLFEEFNHPIKIDLRQS